MAKKTSIEIPTTMIQDLAATTARLLERCPKETSALIAAVVRRLNALPKRKYADRGEELAQHFFDILPEIMRDKKLKPAFAKLVEEFQRLPMTADTQITKASHGDSGSTDFPPIAVAVGIGLAAGTVVATGIIAYCWYHDGC